MPVHRNVKRAGPAIVIPAAVGALAAVFIPRWEGMSLVVEHQHFDPPGVYTVCNGVTNLDPDYAWIRPGMKFTTEKCAEAFQKILPKYYEPLVGCIDGFMAYPPHRQVAVLSFAYNLGPGAVCGDRKHSGQIAATFNAGNAKGACKMMGAYVRANGVTLKGLQNRRFDPKWGEIAWCSRED